MAMKFYIVFVLSCCGAIGVRGEGIVLSDDGQSNYSILLATDSSLSEQHGAKELQYFLHKICGADFHIKTSDMLPTEPVVFVGRNKALEKLGVRIDFNRLGTDGFVIRTVGPNLILAGGKQRGSMYAVYSFLEDYLGCRWYSPSVSVIPKKRTIVLEKIDRREIPAFESRDIYYTSFMRDGLFAARNRINGAVSAVTPELGGKIDIRPFVHALPTILPVKKYFKQHPEYFAEYHGERLFWREAFPCMTNPDVLKIVVQAVEKNIAEHPEAEIFDISPGDGAYGLCDCANCKAIKKKTGTDSGLLIWFANQVARQVKKQYPNKFIEVIAYNATRKPPKHIKADPNVIVRICERDIHPYLPMKLDKTTTYPDIVRQWCKVSDKVYIWHYVTNFGHYYAPNPNFYSVASYLKFYKDVGVDGVFCQGKCQDFGGEFANLRAWFIAKLLWNPCQNPDKVIDDFMMGYYGQAGKYVREYFDLIHQAAISNPEKTDFIDPKKSYLKNAQLKQAFEIFDKAKQLAENKVFRKRVTEASLPVEYTAIQRGMVLVRKKNKFVPSPWANGLRSRIEKFRNTVKSFGYTYLAEVNGNVDKVVGRWLKRIKRLRKTSYPIITLKNDKIVVEIVPGFGGRIIGMWRVDNPVNVMFPGRPDSSDYPFVGGYEDWFGRSWHGPGWDADFKVIKIAKDNSTLILKAKYNNQWIYTRKFKLIPGKVKIEITSIYTNISKKAADRATIHVNAWFSYKALPTEQVYVLQKSRSGKQWKCIDQLNQGPRSVWLNKDWRPTAGVWMIVNPKTGLGLINRIETDNYMKYGRYRIRRWDMEGISGMEFYDGRVEGSPSPKVQQGKSITLTHSYEIVNDYRRLIK